MTNDRVTVHEKRWIHVQCWEKKKKKLTSPAIGVGSLFTLLMVPGLILLITLWGGGGEKKKENEGTLVRKWKDWAIDETEGTNKEPT